MSGFDLIPVLLTSEYPKPPSNASISHGDPQFNGPVLEAADEDYKKTAHVRRILISHLIDIRSSLTLNVPILSPKRPCHHVEIIEERLSDPGPCKFVRLLLDNTFRSTSHVTDFNLCSSIFVAALPDDVENSVSNIRPTTTRRVL